MTISVYAGDLLFHSGLAALLGGESGIRIVESGPDVAVVLFEAAGGDEVARLRRLAGELDRRVVLVARRLDDETLGRITDTGVHSVVWREELSAERLVAAVRAVAGGGGDVPVDLIPRLADQARAARLEARGMLSDREVEVLRLLSEGQDTREVAEKMSYAERTVKGLLHDLMARRGFRNRTHAVASALREGFI